MIPEMVFRIAGAIFGILMLAYVSFMLDPYIKQRFGQPFFFPATFALTSIIAAAVTIGIEQYGQNQWPSGLSLGLIATAVVGVIALTIYNIQSTDLMFGLARSAFQAAPFIMLSFVGARTLLASSILFAIVAVTLTIRTHTKAPVRSVLRQDRES